MPIHQFISYLHAPGDATADLVYAFQTAFVKWGFESCIYCLQADEDAVDANLVGSYIPGPDTLLIYHYAGGSELTTTFLHLSGPRVVYYHNVTPPDLIAPFHEPMARALASGRKQVQLLRELPALVPSEYSRQELLAFGFSQVHIVPLLIDFDRLRESSSNPEGVRISQGLIDAGCIWLAVGRIAPNKRCEDIIKAFAYYHQWINPHSRLIFVGGDKHFEAYAFNLRRLVEKLGLSNSIYWRGWVDYADGFSAYYEAASVFIHMSEHEGFGVPLLEAMAFSVPVIAYNETAVPWTMGDSGVLIREKRYEAIAEMVHLLCTDTELRSDITSKQLEHMQDFSCDVILNRLRNALAPLFSPLG